MLRRFLAAGIAAAAMTAVVVVSSATPTAAAVVEFEDLAGNFTGDEREEIFSYYAGDFQDGLVTFDNGGVSGGDMLIEFYPFVINGSYDPIVGNFDGDAYDEIIWFRPGTGADYLWNFTSLTSADSTPLTISGTYEPVAGDFTGDGVDDILWYAPGTAADYLWEYEADGTHVSIPLTINGRYTPIAASIGTDATDDVFWYAPGTSPEYFWDFVVGTTDYVGSTPSPVNGRYKPFVLDVFDEGWQGDDIFWYAAGTAPDYVWDFFLGERFVYEDPVNGTYDTTTAGDYLADGHDDVVWIGPAAGYLWDHAPSASDPELVERWTYDLFAPGSAASAASTAGDSVAATAAEAGGARIPGTSAGTLPSRG